jgi:hypothetical protein
VSRLRALTIPFVQGQNDAIAREILPDGVLARLVNGRFTKAGELALRRGWRPVAMEDTVGADVVARDLYSYGGSLVALRALDDGSSTLAAAHDPSGVRPWYSASNRLSPATDVRPVGGLPRFSVAANRVSSAVTPDGVHGVVVQQNPAQAETHFRIFKYETDETTAYRQTAAPSFALKVVAATNTDFAMVDDTGAALRLRLVGVDDGLPTVGGTTLVTVASDGFDVATARETAPTALHLVWLDAGDVMYAQFTLAGVQVGLTKTVYAGGDALYAAVASDDVHVHVVYQLPGGLLDGPAELLTFSATSPFGSDVGPTSLFSGADLANAWFDVAATPGLGAGTCAVVGQDQDVQVAGNATVYLSYMDAAHADATYERAGATLSGGLVVYEGQVAYGYSRDNAVVYADEDHAWFVLHGLANDMYEGSAQDDPPYAPGQAPGGRFLVHGRDIERRPVTRAFTVDPSARRQGVSFNGDLYVSGGVVARWANVEVAESGILAPVCISATPSNGSGLLTPSSTYKYRAMLRWTDSRGAVYEGEVSTETEVTLGASDDTVTLVYAIPPSLARSTDILGVPVLEVYRTEAGPGELFYLTDTDNVSVSNDVENVVDTTSDSSLIDERRLYTEGENGATSGRLDNVIPRPASYFAATRDRLVGAPPALEYQVSQLALSSEPVGFTDPGVSGPIALVYFDQANEALTGVAALDDSIVLGTARQLYVTAGDGPNFAGVGEFASPARLPTNVGVYDWRSLVETADGLWFLGDADKLYLLARGEAAPGWVGEAVQDTLASGPVVGAAVDVTDHVVAWAVAATAPVLALRDLQLGAWSTDTLPFDPASLVSHDGLFWAVDDDGLVWRQIADTYGDDAGGTSPVALVAETGDAQVFGLGGQGRLAVVEVEGVFQAAAALLAEISYDQGVSWATLGTATVTGLTVGAPFREQWYPARQRGGKFRVRVTMTPTVSTTEGCRLTGFTVFHTIRGGPSRLPAANRR